MATSAILPISIGVISSSILVFALTALILGRKQKHHLQAFEARTKVAESRAVLFQQKLKEASGEIDQLKKTLGDEREAKVSALHQAQQSFQAVAFKVGTIAACAGLLVGAVASGFVVGTNAETRAMKRLMDLEVNSRVAEERSEFLETQVAGLKDDFRELHRELLREREDKAVALAKLELILESFIDGKKNKKLVFDYQNLMRGLDDQKRRSELERSSALAPSQAVMPLPY